MTLELALMFDKSPNEFVVERESHRPLLNDFISATESGTSSNQRLH